MGRDLGMDTVGFLMMAHMIDEAQFLERCSWNRMARTAFTAPILRATCCLTR